MGDPIVPILSAPVSGLYTRKEWIFATAGMEQQIAERVRLDVDGWFPLMIASGTYSETPGGYSTPGGMVDWIATKLTITGPGVWEGTILEKWGDKQLLPHTSVRLMVPLGVFANGAKLTITFTGGVADVTRTLRFESESFRTAEFEFDVVETAPYVTSVNTWAHSNRPLDLANEELSITEVYSRAGVNVQQSPKETSVVGLEVGEKALKWDDQQLHDAMQMFWSRYKSRAQWALWMLFAHRHYNEDYLGIMFDFNHTKIPGEPDLGPGRLDPFYQRQGAAVFGQRIAEKVPAGDKYPEAWKRRELFFAAVHEIGHCFNLFHSWKKEAGNWLNDPGDLEANSFMNSPYHLQAFAGKDFYATFGYRFDDYDLRFMRHAPSDFVEMGANALGQDHGLSNAGRFFDNSRLTLELTMPRSKRVFEFLEPITVGLTVTNVSEQPQLVQSSLIEALQDLTLIIQPRGGMSQQWRPYARYCTFGGVRLLQPGESLNASLFASAGLDGWHLAEPGSYTLHAHLQDFAGGLRAKPLSLRVAAPRSREEDDLAQDFFTDDVGRALAFGGTYVMTSAIAALEEAADRFKGKAVSHHASLTLALPRMRESKRLQLPEGEASMSSAAADGGSLITVRAKPEEARRMLHEALLSDRLAAAATFGDGAHRRHVEMYADWLHECGDAGAAKKARSSVAQGAETAARGRQEEVPHTQQSRKTLGRRKR